MNPSLLHPVVVAMWLFLTTLLLIFIGKALFNWRRPVRFPPGPVGLPIVGNIFDVKRLVERTKFHSRAWCLLADMYGPIVGLRLGFADPLIIVSGRDAVIEALGRQEFDARPDGFIFRQRTGGTRKGVIFTDGEMWSDQRRFVLRTLKEFGFGKITMEEMILSDAIAITKIIEREAEKGPINNLRSITSLAVLNSIWTMMAGSRLEVGQENSKFNEIIAIMNDATRDANVSGGILNHLPFLRHLMPKLVGFKACSERWARIHGFFQDTIEHHQNTMIQGEPRDLIDAYLTEMQVQKLHNSSTHFDEQQLNALLRDLFAAGTETTTNTICFVIAYLTICQDTQRKVHAEIDKIIGRDALPSIAHRTRLPFLNATLTEVARMANVGPTSVPHRSTTNTTLLGYEIKKNYTILANLMSMHMDKTHWGDPEIFRPERFINDSGEFVDDPWVIPFGLGRRRCLGENLARHSVFLFVACLMQKFHFVLAAKGPAPSLAGVDGFTIAPPDIDVIVVKRD